MPLVSAPPRGEPQPPRSTALIRSSVVASAPALPWPCRPRARLLAAVAERHRAPRGVLAAAAAARAAAALAGPGRACPPGRAARGRGARRSSADALDALAAPRVVAGQDRARDLARRVDAEHRQRDRRADAAHRQQAPRQLAFGARWRSRAASACRRRRAGS